MKPSGYDHALVERLRSVLCNETCCDDTRNDAADLIEELERKLKRLPKAIPTVWGYAGQDKDAERYQWLKTIDRGSVTIRACGNFHIDYPNGVILFTVRTQHVHGATVDEVIDKAMELTKGDPK